MMLLPKPRTSKISFFSPLVASRQEQTTESNEDQPIIILSDEDTSSDSNPYVMNSSSDDEFLYSCLEVESEEAIKVRCTEAKVNKRIPSS